MSPLKIAFLTTFIDLLGFGIIIPIQPFYAESFGASPATITLLGASYSLMQFLLSGPIGKLSDRVGRRPVLLVSVVLIMVGYVAFAQATTITGLFIARIISGIGGANLGAAQAIIADVTPPDQRARGMGLIGAAFGLGFVFGPALGGFLGQWGVVVPIYAAAFLAFINLCFIYFKLPETLHSLREDRHQETQVNEELEAKSEADYSSILGQIWSYQNVPQLLGIALSFTLAFAMMEQTVGLFIEQAWVSESLSLTERHREASTLTAYFLVAVGVGASIVQGGLIGRLTKRFGEVTLSRAGMIVVIGTFLAIPWVGAHASFAAMLFIGIIMACGTGMLHPSRNSLLSQSCPPEIQGRALGVNQSLSSLGRVIGPASAGFLFEINPNTPFWVGAVVMLISLFFVFSLSKPHSITPPSDPSSSTSP